MIKSLAPKVSVSSSSGPKASSSSSSSSYSSSSSSSYSSSSSSSSSPSSFFNKNGVVVQPNSKEYIGKNIQSALCDNVRNYITKNNLINFSDVYPKNIKDIQEFYVFVQII